ncbi:RNase H domain-containing protein [Aphis craccivora]|uniref:RNase H domain-containing protein n=1 Tax=Aphis craccivora TaxID=307492 RepID=A0A6G0WDT3_APHCR|nr:RNase H domain-containing protein [Aphis craccivora]
MNYWITILTYFFFVKLIKVSLETLHPLFLITSDHMGTLLPSHSFKLDLNDSPFCKLHLNECICDLSQILFDFHALISERLALINSLRSFNCPFNLHSILNTNCIFFTIKIYITYL